MLSDNARTMGPLRQKLQYVDVWLRRRHLSDRLARRVRAYYTEIWVDHEGVFSLLLLQHNNTMIYRCSSQCQAPSRCVLNTVLSANMLQHALDGNYFAAARLFVLPFGRMVLLFCLPSFFPNMYLLEIIVKDV